MDSFITKSFNKNERITILETQSALKKYTDEIGKAQNLDSSLPIVLDTNVLLKFYRISFHEREQLKSFSDYPFMHLLYSQLLVCQRVCLQNTVCLICK